MFETAIYVLLGALATALLALLALPAVSRRAFRLADARARLQGPLSATQALADRDALRGRHAIEVTLVERRAEAALEASAAAQVAMGRQSAQIVQRDMELLEKRQEIARQREELAGQASALRERDTEIAAREVAMFDFVSQRDAANLRVKQTTARLEDCEAQIEDGRMIHASLETRFAVLANELVDVRRAAAAALSAANATTARLGDRLAASVAEAERLQASVNELRAREAETSEAALADLPSGAPEPEGAPTRRDYYEVIDDGMWPQTLATAHIETEAALRAARAERDALARELAEARETLAASDRRAREMTEADRSLRQTIANLGRDLIEGRSPANAFPSGESLAAGRSMSSDLTL